ncbi:hypothetical protein MASR2M15_28640 [Anaerolineales bacterium]
MADGFFAHIIGIPHIPSITEVNVRPNASTDREVLFRVLVCKDELKVLDVQEDLHQNQLYGKIYQWFYLQFPNGSSGWVRDDLIEVYGDGSLYGYGRLNTPQVAYNLTRNKVFAPHQEENNEIQIEVTVTADSGDQTKVTVTPGDNGETAVTVTDNDGDQTQVTTDTNENTEAGPSISPTAPTTPPQSDEPGKVIGMARSGTNIRPGPGTQFNPVVARLAYKQEAKILEVKRGQNAGDLFHWIHIQLPNGDGWIREDFVRLKGNFEEFGLGHEDQYPSPIPESSWIRDFNLDPNITWVHHGWDHAAPIGTPIYGGPNGGMVVKTAFCDKCGNAGVSVIDRGFEVSDPRVLRDPAWNYGYGHYVIVRYDHEILPASTQSRLNELGFAGYHAFVMYAHLQQFNVSEGTQLVPNQQIGTCGNSGNSTGAHLHLELRFGAMPQAEWWAIKSGLVTPAELFLR